MFHRRAFVLALAFVALHGCGSDEDRVSTESILRWNSIAIDASGLDHTPVAPGENRIFGQQVGPCRAAKAMAVVHIAMFEAVNAIAGGHKSYVGLAPVDGDTSLEAAVAQAARDALVHLYSSQAPTFDARLAEDLAKISNGAEKTAGIELGRRAAAAIVAMRETDGSAHPEPRMGTDYIPSLEPGMWRQDPISRHPLALGSHWDTVKPFVMQSAAQFRVVPPPALNSAAYATAYNEVKRLGGDGRTTATQRTAEQTQIGIYWAYDGMPSLCAPPRLYNQIAVKLAKDKDLDGVELARLLALANVAMADAGIAIWESKYHYAFWRPIGGIREADAGTGPTGKGDGNADTAGDSGFMPLGAPASNATGPNFTPPFPSYPSGHAGFGGALFETLRDYFGKDDIPFTFVSDEYNGVTRDNQGAIRPLLERRFTSFTQAEEENGQSRIYLGIHWSFDKTEGIAQGRKIGDYVFANAFQPQ